MFSCYVAFCTGEVKTRLEDVSQDLRFEEESEEEEVARVGKGGWVAGETWASSQPQLLIPPPPPKRKIRNGAKFPLLTF